MSPKRQANWYDKVFKENLPSLSLTLARRVLGIEVVSSESLSTDLAHTLERKPDQVLRITDAAGTAFLLHLEFQVANEARMAERMLQYWLLLRGKYDLPLRQVVFYLGSQPLQMADHLQEGRTSHHFDLLVMNQLDYRLFADSEQAATVVFAVLGNFGVLTPEQATRQVVERLGATASDQLELDRCLQQLRVLANLRQLQPLLDEIMESITEYFDPKIDPWYKKGKLEGEQEGELKGVERVGFNLLAEGAALDFVAKVTGLSVERLRELQKRLPQ